MEPSTSIDSPYSAESMMSNEERSCKVCFDKSDGAHLGVDSCRACAAFFRRSVVMKKKYICRQGKNNCDINKSVRCMCRKCRLRKCLDAGMTPESVQSKRDPIVPRRNDSEPLSAYVETSCSENELKASTSAYVSAFHPVVTQGSPSHMTNPYVETVTELPQMLFKITENYKHLCSVKRTTELSMLLSSAQGMFGENGTIVEEYHATYKPLSQIHRMETPAIGEFVTKTFPEFTTLSKDDMWVVFQNFILTLWILDSAYKTYTRVPPEDFVKKNWVSEVMYIHQDRLEEFLSDAPEGSMHRSDLASVLRVSFTGPRLRIVQQMQELQIQEQEFSAILALVMWNSGIEGSNDPIEAIAKGIRKQIYRQLHLWYRPEKDKEAIAEAYVYHRTLRLNGMQIYAERMGEFLNLVNSAMQNRVKMREDLELCHLFDIFKEDPFLYDIMSSRKEHICQKNI